MPIVFTRSNKVALLCLWVAIPVGFAQKVHTERDTSIDISKLKNFRFKERVRPPTDPLGAYPEAEGWVKESIEEELADRGISRLQSGDPDFWIRYDAATRQRTEKLAGSRISIAGFLHHYMEATLTVEFIDEHSERVLWSGGRRTEPS